MRVTISNIAFPQEAGEHGVWHYRTTVTAIASIAGMMLRCGK
jgi:hypothetical protein